MSTSAVRSSVILLLPGHRNRGVCRAFQALPRGAKIEVEVQCAPATAPTARGHGQTY